jgi:hypothetical protein
MAKLIRGGAQCFVVDFAESQIDGISRLGTALTDIAQGERFDAIVMSHLLEHVADPRELLVRAAQLAPVIFAEVPVEIWRGTPTSVDPVVHINHFTDASLRNALAITGWHTRKAGTNFSSYRGGTLEVTWAVATVERRDTLVDGVSTAVKRLHPGLGRRVTRRVSWQLFRARQKTLQALGRPSALSP